MRSRRIGRFIMLFGGVDLFLGLLICAFLMRPGIFGLSVYQVKTSSMSPGIPVGSDVYIRNGNSDIDVGDIIVYEDSGGREILHRVIGENLDGYLILKGDANIVPDPEPVDESSVAGRMVVSIRDAGVLDDFLSVAGMSLLCTGLSLVLAGWGLSVNHKSAAHDAGKD